MPNLENALYRLLLFDFIIIFIFIFTHFFPSALLGFLLRAYWAVLMIWCLIFAYYIFIVAHEKQHRVLELINKKYKNFKISILVLVGISIILSLLEFLLPLNVEIMGVAESHKLCRMRIIYVGQGALVGTGPASSLCLFFVFFLLFFTVLMVIVKRKNINKKKIFPLIAIEILFVISLIIEGVFPMGIVCPLLTLICYFMYHTIENPDLKLINQLTLAKDAAEKANHAKSDFLASMSHELRTPLNAIVGLSQSLLNSDIPENCKQDTRDILVASEKLTDIIQSVLDINKLDNNQMDISEEKYNPTILFNDMVRLMGMKIEGKSIELRTNVSSNLPFSLYGDKDKVRQIVSNILSNAIKYTDEGYVDFIVTCDNDRDKCDLKITIADTGRGIKKEQIENIFNRFYRLDEDKDSNISGTGLGLSLTKSLVQLLDGSINVDSEFGKGSTFTVTLCQKILDSKEEITNNNQEVEML